MDERLKRPRTDIVHVEYVEVDEDYRRDGFEPYKWYHGTDWTSSFDQDESMPERIPGIPGLEVKTTSTQRNKRYLNSVRPCLYSLIRWIHFEVDLGCPTAHLAQISV